MRVAKKIPVEAESSEKIRENREFVFTQKHFAFLRNLSFEHSGIVVKDEKFDMFYARLVRRIRALGLDGFDAYCDYVGKENNDEFGEFINALTTNMTSFFRENHHFEFLSNQVFPALKRRVKNGQVRIWSAGCSTGKEPYSIAMTIKESAAQLAGINCHILATDLDSQVLQQAASGVYPMSRCESLGQARLKRFFHRGVNANADKARAVAELRSLISFKQLNLLKGWPFREKFDVIFCRNVMIYFDEPTKNKLINRFVEQLSPGGYLFIGHSESLTEGTLNLKFVGGSVYQKTL